MGDPYYDRDGITIYHADCGEVLPGIDPASVDLLLTDPPYGINHDTDYTRFASNKTYAPVANDLGPFDPSHLLVFPRVALFGGNYFDLPMAKWVVWVKRDIESVMGSPMSDAELVWHNCGGKPVSVFNWYWHGAYRKGEMGSHLHPTQKPVALMRWLVEKWTEPGDLILDPYMGSGPIAQAAQDLNRKYIGIEIEETYCQTATNRLAQQTLTL